MAPLAQVVFFFYFSILSSTYKVKEEKERAEKEEEERRNRKELEDFQRKFDKGGRQSKERRRGVEHNPTASKSVGFHLVAGTILILSIAVALWWMNSR